MMKLMDCLQFLLLKFLILGSCSILPVRFTQATYSLVATDSETRQVGGVGATCLVGWDVYKFLYNAAPNRSVLHTQGWLLSRDPDDPIVTLAMEKMMDGESTPEQVLQSMLEADTTRSIYNGYEFDSVDARQYVIAGFESTSAYTGSELAPTWEFLGYPNTEITDLATTHGENDRFLTHAAGNVVSNGTVQTLQAGFANVTGSPFGGEEDDLAGRLMSALYHVLIHGHGDVRCLEELGTTASGAYLHIDNPDGTPLLHINVIDGLNPVADVIDAFLEWRKTGSVVSEPSSDSLVVSSASNSLGLFTLDRFMVLTAALLVTVPYIIA